MSYSVTLTGPRFGPAAGGAPRQLVILLHGWGADGNDLIGLAPPLAQVLPHAEFLAPNAPFPCDAGQGLQWFSLGDMDPRRGMSDDAMQARLGVVAPMVDAFIDAALEQHGLAPAKLALLGFSQGTMTALHVGLRRSAALAGILGYSGHLVAGPALLAEAPAKPPILLVHGEQDQVLPVAASRYAEELLRQHGFPVEAVYRPGLGHGIDEEGLRRGALFLKRVLGG